MKTRRLLLMRHAKSDWADSSLSDHDRPLNKRGRRDAPKVAQWIADRSLLPSRILCSSAVRTCETAAALIDRWAERSGSEIPVSTLESLYLAAPETILNVICSENDDAENLLVLGHNPGMVALVSGLSGQYRDMPTAAVAVFELELERWADLCGPEQVTLIDAIRPKEIA